MTSTDRLSGDLAIAGPLGSLALSVVRPAAPTLALRAVAWHRDLERLGIVLPFVVVHDVGLALAAPSDRRSLGPRVDAAAIVGRLPRGREVIAAYRSIVESIAESETARRAGALHLGDDLVVVVLARLLGEPSKRIAARPAYGASLPLDVALFDRLDERLTRLFAAAPREFDLAGLAALEASRLYLLTVADALDLDTLRLLGMLGDEEGAGALAQVDLLATMSSPAANDVVNFSLELLPSVLETKTRPAAATFAVAGHAGIGTKGSIDNLVLTELAWDDDELARRLVESEVLFYAREQSHERGGKLHWLLIDASASMRGDRAVFARGIALATAKKLLLAGDGVAFRFFDSRLYDPKPCRAGRVPAAHVLSFKGEHGRNPARVFSELIVELDLARARTDDEIVVHLFTHAALHVPRALVSEARKRAHVACVFILPSGGKLDLEWVDLLDATWVVDHETLAEKRARADKARAILDDVGDAAAEATERAP